MKEEKPAIGKKPIKLYFLITIMLLIGIVILSLMVKNLFIGKFQGKEKAAETPAKEAEDESIQQTKSIFGLAAVIFLIMIVFFVIAKVTKKN